MSFFLARLREPSSWAGFATIAASIASAVQHRDIGAIVSSVVGAAAVLLPEKGQP
jgi:hypothetical protein